MMDNKLHKNFLLNISKIKFQLRIITLDIPNQPNNVIKKEKLKLQIAN